MGSELESLGEQGLHHEAHLVFGGGAFGSGFDGVAVGGDPVRQVGEHRLALIRGQGELVGESDVGESGKSAEKRPPPGDRRRRGRGGS